MCSAHSTSYNLTTYCCLFLFVCLFVSAVRSGVNYNVTLVGSGSDMGCDRLSSRPASVQVCAFLGEALEFDCQNTSMLEDETVNHTKNGIDQPLNLKVSSAIQSTSGNYSCAFSNIDCGDVVETIIVQVYGLWISFLTACTFKIPFLQHMQIQLS